MIPKFRVWLPDTTQMLRVKALVFEKDRTRCVCGYSFDFSLEDENATIMQSTGLCDKVGTEVFEGDILCDEGIEQESEFVYVTVSYREGMWVCDQITNELCGYGGALNEFNNDYSIIGNIYKNPELLEVENGE